MVEVPMREGDEDGRKALFPEECDKVVGVLARIYDPAVAGAFVPQHDAVCGDRTKWQNLFFQNNDYTMQ